MTAGIPLVFLAVFYFYPLLSIFGLSFFPRETLDLSWLHKLVSTPYYLKTLWFTFWQAVLSTVLTILAAFPGAYMISRFRFPGKKILQAFTTVPFVLPTIVVAAAMQALFGPKGMINAVVMKWFGLDQPLIQTSHSVWYILLAHVFLNYTVALRIISGFWSRLDPSLMEAARVLGASPRQVFFKVTLPLLKPAVWASAILVFIFCFSSFGIVLILGGPRYATIEVEIYRQAVHLFNLPMAAALSLLQIVFMLGMMGVYTSLQKRVTVSINPVSIRESQRPIRSGRDRWILALNLIFILVVIGIPIMALLVRSVYTRSGLSLMFYRALFENPLQSIFYVPPVDAILYSCGFALVTLVMALVIGLSAAEFLSKSTGKFTAILDPIFMLPLSTSAVTLGFGFIVALDEPPLNLRTSLMLVPLAHTLVAFPFVVRSVLPALRSIPGSLREVAAVLGASPIRVWRAVELPIVARAVIVGIVFAFTISLGEFGATVFVARPQTPTMPLAIYRFLEQPGSLNYGQAMAMSSILMLVTAAGFLFLERLRVDSMGEF